jgi:hypothetical protein
LHRLLNLLLVLLITFHFLHFPLLYLLPEQVTVCVDKVSEYSRISLHELGVQMLLAISLLACLDVGRLVITLDELREGLWLTHFVHVYDGVTGPDFELLRGGLGGFRSGGVGSLSTLLLGEDGALGIEVSIVLALVCTLFFKDGNVLSKELAFTIYN